MTTRSTWMSSRRFAARFVAGPILALAVHGCGTPTAGDSGGQSAPSVRALHGSDPNVALNPSRAGYPDPSESSPGWGGGSSPWDMLDGSTKYYDTWAHGLAFTGGRGNWAGEACGTRYATINFGAPRRVHAARVWHHGDEHIPNSYWMEHWNGSSWAPTGGTSAVRYDLRSDTDTWGATPTEHVFPEVETSKIRF